MDRFWLGGALKEDENFRVGGLQQNISLSFCFMGLRERHDSLVGVVGAVYGKGQVGVQQTDMRRIGVLRQTADNRKRTITAISCCLCPVTILPWCCVDTCAWYCIEESGHHEDDRQTWRRYKKCICEPTYDDQCGLLFCSILNPMHYWNKDESRPERYLTAPERQGIGLPDLLEGER